MLFEENLLPGECSIIIRQASLELEDEDGQQILKSQFTKRGHMLRKSINQETDEITFV